jgi:hypothetical protein
VSSRFSLLVLLAMLSMLAWGCALYRHTDYTLRFLYVRTGSPPQDGQLGITFMHELFPLNAPRPIHL